MSENIEDIYEFLLISGVKCIGSTAKSKGDKIRYSSKNDLEKCNNFCLTVFTTN